MKIIIINGPNLNLLNKRDKSIYSLLTIDEIVSQIKVEFPEIEIESYQSNIEGEIVTWIQQADSGFDGMIINPGAYAHTSIAIKDALEICNIPKIEVHLSHLANREDFRQNLITAQSTNGYISGFKENSYLAAVYLLKKLIKE